MSASFHEKDTKLLKMYLLNIFNGYMNFKQGRSELEETLKRLQQHKGVTGVIVVNGER